MPALPAALPPAGRIAFVSQSGALGTAVLDWAQTEDVGFSYFISLGNLLDVGFADTIDYLASDDQTDALILYVESIAHARDFLSAARAFTHRKPIVVHKAGRSMSGAKRRPVTRERWPARTPVTKPPFAAPRWCASTTAISSSAAPSCWPGAAPAGRAWQSSPMPAVRPSWLPTH